MKIIGNRVLIFWMLIIIFPVMLLADSGPKPSVVLNFEGLEGETYYITLLSQTETTGPYSTSDEPIEANSLLDDEEPLRIKAWQAFRDYKDEDGFYFIEYLDKNNEEQNFIWGYYPPEVFKVLLYFPERDVYKVSDICERYAFDSYFSVEVNDLDEIQALKVEKNYDYTGEIISFIARVLITIVVELLVALCFGIRKKKLLVPIILVNVLTQCILNILLNLSHYGEGSFSYIFYYTWLEMVVFIIEATLFTKLFKKNGIYKIKVPVVYALVANVCSFVAGVWLATRIPGIF